MPINQHPTLMKKQRTLSRRLIIPCLGLAFGSLGQAAVLQIANPGFELDGDVMPGVANPETPVGSDPGDWTSGPASGAVGGGIAVPGWDGPFTPGPGAGVFNPVGSPSVSAHTGNLVGYSNGGNGWVTQWLMLDGAVQATAEPGAEINIGGWFSNRLSATPVNLHVSIRVAPNDNIVPPVTLTPPETPDWTEWNANFTLPDAATLGANLGAPLFLVLENTGGNQVLYDDIQGTYTVIPEPGMAWLALAGLAGLWIRRKR